MSAAASDDIQSLARVLVNALRQKVKGQPHTYTIVVGQLSSANDDTLRRLFLALQRVVGDLAKSPAAFDDVISAALGIRLIPAGALALMDGAVVGSGAVNGCLSSPQSWEAHAGFLAALVSASGVFLHPVLKSFMRNLLLLVQLEGRLAGQPAAAVPLQPYQAVVYRTLARLLATVPTSGSAIFSSLAECYPHPRLPLGMHAAYARHLLHVASALPSLRDRLLATLVDRMVDLDTEIVVEELELGGEAGEEEGQKLPPEAAGGGGGGSSVAVPVTMASSSSGGMVGAGSEADADLLCRRHAQQQQQQLVGAHGGSAAEDAGAVPQPELSPSADLAGKLDSVCLLLLRYLHARVCGCRGSVLPTKAPVASDGPSSSTPGGGGEPYASGSSSAAPSSESPQATTLPMPLPSSSGGSGGAPGRTYAAVVASSSTLPDAAIAATRAELESDAGACCVCFRHASAAAAGGAATPAARGASAADDEDDVMLIEHDQEGEEEGAGRRGASGGTGAGGRRKAAAPHRPAAMFSDDEEDGDLAAAAAVAEHYSSRNSEAGGKDGDASSDGSSSSSGLDDDDEEGEEEGGKGEGQDTPGAVRRGAAPSGGGPGAGAGARRRSPSGSWPALASSSAGAAGAAPDAAGGAPSPWRARPLPSSGPHSSSSSGDPITGGQRDEGRDHTFAVMLGCFERSVLLTHRAKFTQFVLFYTCALEPRFADRFVARLLRQIRSSERPPAVRAMCAAYLGSFLARAAFLEEATLRSALYYLVEFASQYLALEAAHAEVEANADAAGGGGPSATPSPPLPPLPPPLIFLSVMQAAFYVVCFRGASFRAHEGGIEFLASLPWAALLASERVDPLAVVLPSVAAEFLRVATLLQIVPQEALAASRAYARLTSNNAAGVQQAEQASPEPQCASGSSEAEEEDEEGEGSDGPGSGAGTHSSLTQRRRQQQLSGTGGGGADLSGQGEASGGGPEQPTPWGQNPLDSFFPFDPLMLRRCSRYVGGVYRGWAASELTSDDPATHEWATETEGYETGGQQAAGTTRGSSKAEEGEDPDPGDDSVSPSSGSASGARAVPPFPSRLRREKGGSRASESAHSSGGSQGGRGGGAAPPRHHPRGRLASDLIERTDEDEEDEDEGEGGAGGLGPASGEGRGRPRGARGALASGGSCRSTATSGDGSSAAESGDSSGEEEEGRGGWLGPASSSAAGGGVAAQRRTGGGAASRNSSSVTGAAAWGVRAASSRRNTATSGATSGSDTSGVLSPPFAAIAVGAPIALGTVPLRPKHRSASMASPTLTGVSRPLPHVPGASSGTPGIGAAAPPTRTAATAAPAQQPAPPQQLQAEYADVAEEALLASLDLDLGGARRAEPDALFRGAMDSMLGARGAGGSPGASPSLQPSSGGGGGGGAKKRGRQLPALAGAPVPAAAGGSGLARLRAKLRGVSFDESAYYASVYAGEGGGAQGQAAGATAPSRGYGGDPGAGDEAMEMTGEQGGAGGGSSSRRTGAAPEEQQQDQEAGRGSKKRRRPESRSSSTASSPMRKGFSGPVGPEHPPSRLPGSSGGGGGVAGLKGSGGGGRSAPGPLHPPHHAPGGSAASSPYGSPLASPVFTYTAAAAAVLGGAGQGVRKAFQLLHSQVPTPHGSVPLSPLIASPALGPLHRWQQQQLLLGSGGGVGGVTGVGGSPSQASGSPRATDGLLGLAITGLPIIAAAPAGRGGRGWETARPPITAAAGASQASRMAGVSASPSAPGAVPRGTGTPSLPLLPVKLPVILTGAATEPGVASGGAGGSSSSPSSGMGSLRDHAKQAHRTSLGGGVNLSPPFSVPLGHHQPASSATAFALRQQAGAAAVLLPPGPGSPVPSVIGSVRATNSALLASGRSYASAVAAAASPEGGAQPWGAGAAHPSLRRVPSATSVTASGTGIDSSAAAAAAAPPSPAAPHLRPSQQQQQFPQAIRASAASSAAAAAAASPPAGPAVPTAEDFANMMFMVADSLGGGPDTGGDPGPGTSGRAGAEGVGAAPSSAPAPWTLQQPHRGKRAKAAAEGSACPTAPAPAPHEPATSGSLVPPPSTLQQHVMLAEQLAAGGPQPSRRTPPSDGSTVSSAEYTAAASVGGGTGPAGSGEGALREPRPLVASAAAAFAAMAPPPQQQQQEWKQGEGGGALAAAELQEVGEQSGRRSSKRTAKKGRLG